MITNGREYRIYCEGQVPKDGTLSEAIGLEDCKS